MLRALKDNLYPTLSKYLTAAMIVEGLLKETDVPFRFLLIGDSMLTEYLQSKIYTDPPSVREKWHIWEPALKKIILNPPDSIDMCIAVLPVGFESALHGLYDFKCQTSVHQIIDVSGTWEDVRSRFCKKKRQITKDFDSRYGLSYKVSRDLHDFDLFYNRMYVPHVRKHFGKLAMIDSYDDLREFFLNGLLLFINRNNEAVAGALSRIEKDVLIFHRTGILDGDESHIKCGAQTALYFFQLKYANDHSLHSVDCTTSPPFLNDGVYRHKRDWGATVLPYEESKNWVYFFNTGPAEKVALFFEKNPTIVYSDEGLKGVLGISSGTDVSDASVRDLTHRYNAAGIHGFAVMTPEGKISAGAETRSEYAA